MVANDIDGLRSLINAGGRPTERLWLIRRTPITDRDDESALQSLSDLWSLAFHVDGLFPKLEAAKAIVDIAWAGDISYPVLTNDGTIYESLELEERRQLFDYIAECIGEERASVAGAALAEFADDLVEGDPTV